MRSVEEEEVSSVLGRESVCAQYDPSLHLRTEAGRARMCVHFTRRSSYSVARQGDVRPVLDAVVAREVAARLCARDHIVRTQGVAAIREGNGEHGRTAIL